LFRKNFYQKLFIIFFVLAFILNTNFIASTARANQQIDQQKSQTEQQLEKLNADRNVYESQVSDLENKFLDLGTQMQTLTAQQAKINLEIQSSNQNVQKLKNYTPTLLNQRKELANELYMLTDDKLFYLTYFVDTNSFFNLLKGKDETQIVIQDKVKKIGLIDKVLDLIKQREALYQKDIAGLQSQQQDLTGQITYIYSELQTHQNELKNIDLQAINLQSYLLSLQHIDSLNDRDFVSMNSATGDNFQFIGGGTEHGVGMSQYGAEGMAKMGKNYFDILGHYYTNTKVATRNTSGVNIRVGIVLGGSGGRVYVRGGSAHLGGQLINQDGFIDVSPSIGDATLTPDSGSTYFEVDYKLSGYNQYYGSLEFKNIGGSLYTINIINIEQYLRGVVPAESPHSWPIEALKAQAVAARSYALCNINSDPGSAFDVDDTTRFQVYLGKSYYQTETDQAVSQTAGQVVVYGADVVPAYFFSTSGGYTENNENVWGGSPRPYLRGVPSPWETDSPYWSWSTQTFSRAELSQILDSDNRTSIGVIQQIDIINRGISGRVIGVKLTGSTATKIITGQDFRQVLNLNIGVSYPPMQSVLFGVKSP
jgi:stage II sporulation protein D